MEITEENFILMLKQKDERALEYIIDNYGWIIKTIVKKSMYNLESYQEECINDILLGVWNNIDRFDKNKCSFKNWLAAISKYKSIDYKRKYLKDLKNENIENVNLNIDDNSHENIIKNEINLEMEKMLNCLKEKDKEIFLRLYVNDEDLDSISYSTGIKKDVLYNRISRGKRKIKQLFSLKEFKER